MAEQLKQALSKNAGRVIDLFREWDADGDGQVSKKEFRKAMPVLGLEVPTKEIDALFNEWDKDGGGSISYEELKKLLKGPAAPAAPAQKPGNWKKAQAAAPKKERRVPAEEEEEVLDRASLKKKSADAAGAHNDPKLASVASAAQRLKAASSNDT